MAEIGRQVGTGHRSRSIMLQVTENADGSYGLITPQAPGWGALVRNQPDLARALVAAFREVDVASYSRWKGQSYDMDGCGAAVVRRSRRRTRVQGRSRADVYPPEEWVALPDGRWRSPSGRAYRADSRTVQRVRDKRKRLGLPH